MNKEEKKIIERIEDTFYSNTGKKNNHFQKVTLYEEGITDILKLLNFVEKQQKELEQKESILDKVTDKLKEDIRNDYCIKEIIGDAYITTGVKEYSVKPYAQEILNIIEGEKE